MRAEGGIAAGHKPAHRQAILRAVLDALHSGRHDEAVSLSQPLLRVRDIEVLLLHGLALGASGEPSASARMLCEVARERPDALHPCRDLSSLLVTQQRGADAEATYFAALELTPNDPRLLLAYGDYLAGQWRPEDAEVVLRRSLRLRPDDLGALNQLGIVLVGLGQMPEALSTFQKAVAINPANHAAWANLGCALANEGAFDDALSYYHRAIRLKPDDPQIRLNHSICLLKSGRMTQGWTEHEWRFALPGHTQLPRSLLLPSLGPDTDLSGSTVLVTQEEGFGDTLMYLRYVPLLADRGARVLLWVPDGLRRVAERMEPRAIVRSGDVANPEFTWHCPFISLPRAFAGTVDALGRQTPYLRTDPERVAAMAAHLPPRQGQGQGQGQGHSQGQGQGSRRLRVGLVWGGAPRPGDPVAHGIDRRRSIGLAALAPLAELADVDFISLQKGPYAEQMAEIPVGLVLHDPMGQVHDMDDTASLLMSLDLVVTVDTSIVHLAGGLGRPTILLDRYDNCWRWLHGREDSEWYPSVRIIRQSHPGDWRGVVERLKEVIRTAR